MVGKFSWLLERPSDLSLPSLSFEKILGRNTEDPDFSDPEDLCFPYLAPIPNEHLQGVLKKDLAVPNVGLRCGCRASHKRPRLMFFKEYGGDLSA
jgi:hypothetical protein